MHNLDTHVEAAEEVDPPAPDRIGRCVSLCVDAVDKLLRVRPVVARLTVHVPQDLSAADADAVDAGIDRVGNVGKLESGRHVCDEPRLVGEMHQLERVFKADLEDDAL